MSKFVLPEKNKPVLTGDLEEYLQEVRTKYLNAVKEINTELKRHLAKLEQNKPIIMKFSSSSGRNPHFMKALEHFQQIYKTRGYDVTHSIEREEPDDGQYFVHSWLQVNIS